MSMIANSEIENLLEKLLVRNHEGSDNGDSLPRKILALLGNGGDGSSIDLYLKSDSKTRISWAVYIINEASFEIKNLQVDAVCELGKSNEGGANLAFINYFLSNPHLIDDNVVRQFANLGRKGNPLVRSMVIFWAAKISDVVFEKFVLFGIGNKIKDRKTALNYLQSRNREKRLSGIAYMLRVDGHISNSIKNLMFEDSYVTDYLAKKFPQQSI